MIMINVRHKKREKINSLELKDETKHINERLTAANIAIELPSHYIN